MTAAVWLALVVGPAVAVTIVAATVACDWIAARRRDHRAPRLIVERHTYRDVCHRVTELIERGEITRARAAITGICAWHLQQLSTASPHDRVRHAAALERWELWKSQLPTSVVGAQHRLDRLRKSNPAGLRALFGDAR